MEDRAFIGPIADNLINLFVVELKKKKNKDKLMKNIIEPVLNDVSDRYYPYIMSLTLLLVLIIALLLILIVVLANGYGKIKCTSNI